MVTVIKYGNVNECECEECKSTLRYYKTDIQHHIDRTYYYKNVESYIQCPVCGSLIKVNNELVGEVKLNIQ